MTRNSKIKSIANNFEYREDFEYSHKNPYHERLKGFDDFVLRDKESEEFKNKWNKEVFKNDLPIAVEVGTGYGHFMLDFAQKYPDENFIGIDHRFKRSFALAKRLAKLEHTNFRYLRARGERLEFTFGENEIDKIFYFFPDPWPKNRHHKKRLFQAPFLKACYTTLKPGCQLFIKTDHDEYFEWMEKFVADQDMFEVVFRTLDLHLEAPDHFLSSFQTKFEKIFLAKKIKIKAMVLKKKIK